MDKTVIQRIKSQKPLIYYPLTAKLTGSIISAILLEQILYWWERNGNQPFYKFRKPCKASRPGDSWVEELGFTITEFDNARNIIATKIKKGDSKSTVLETEELPTSKQNEPAKEYIIRCRELLKHLVLYWTDATGKTWYQVNVPLVGDSFYLIHSGESGFPILLKSADSRFSFFTESISENNSTDSSASEGDGKPDKLSGTITPAIKGNVTRIINRYIAQSGGKVLTIPLWEKAVAEQQNVINEMVIPHKESPAKWGTKKQTAELILKELKTRNPQNTPPQKESPATDGMLMLVIKLWGLPPAATGKAWNIRHLLTGTSKTGQWGKCKLITPASPEELRAYKKWRNAQGRGQMAMPEKPDQLQKSFEEFRRHHQYAHFMRQIKQEEATPSERAEIQDGVQRTASSEQVNLYEIKMPRAARIKWYEQQGVAYDPETGIRIGADAKDYG